MVYWSIYLVGCRLADWSIHLSVGYIVERLVDWWVDWKIGLLVVTEYVNLIPSTNQPMNEVTYWSISWAAFWITAETFHFFFLFKSSFWMTANVQRTSKDRLVQATQYSRHPRHPPFPLTDTLSRNVEFTSLLLFFLKLFCCLQFECLLYLSCQQNKDPPKSLEGAFYCRLHTIVGSAPRGKCQVGTAHKHWIGKRRKYKYSWVVDFIKEIDLFFSIRWNLQENVCF